MDGKVCLITGASGGIGLEAAKALAGLGATVVLVGRDATRTEAAVSAVRAAAPGAKVEWLKADLASLQSVRELAATFKARYPRLDVLLNNAGLILDNREVTGDGLEGTMATNHFAPFLLTNLLLDVLKASAPARVVTVSSDAHRVGRMDLADLQSERDYASFRVYGTSKLANILFTRALAKRLKGTGVTANCLHPGVVRTGFGHNTKGFFRHIVKLGAPFMLSAEKGARTSIYLASSPEVESVSGEYFYKCRPKKASSAARDDALAERLWQVSEQLTGVKA
ncbi:SDR family oxidoreductase [Pyxidicoccus sp. MSG2]|uniref:SDR family oxidoreductase n=1 Tax=Pyxidicoccus sp. MSG2 TaxID=2996790 RepID=UPI002271CECF|nr:SDR family oxidoreductase [Pyxidicoccus sp. MSG2]MCY1017060.1 SDR family oxidoreductase [Pyxidicoccus sp. MSG2]